jgi:CRISPR/Cas system-associated exonuclease Cas4 (RecB family)
MTIIKTAIDAYVSHAEPAFSSSDRASTVGASEIGACIRQTYWRKNEGTELGVERDPEFTESWGARKRGSVIERMLWVPAMRKKFGRRLLFAGRSQKTFAHKHLSATPDGLAVRLTPLERKAITADCGDCVTLECKSSDPRTNLAEAKSQHTYQTQVQLGLIRTKTPHRPTHALLSYIDASFWSEVTEFVVAYDERIYQSAQDRAQRIMRATSVDKLPPEGWIAGGAECRHCPFTRACGIERRNLPFADNDVKLDKQFVSEIEDLARAVKGAEHSRDACDALMRAKQDELKSRLRDKGIRKVPGIVSWSSVKGRESWDNKKIREAAEAAGVDIGQYNTVGEPTDRLLILIGADSSDPAAHEPGRTQAGDSNVKRTGKAKR